MGSRCRALGPVLLLAVAPAFGDFDFRVESRVGAVSGPGWRAEGIDLALIRSEDGAGLELAVERLNLPEPLPALSGVALECADLALTTERVQCEDGRFRYQSPGGEPVTGPVRFEYTLATQALEFALLGLPLAGGELTVRGQAGEAGWEIELGLARQQAGALAALLQPLLPNWKGIRGRLTVSARLSGQGSEMAEARFLITGNGLKFDAADGRQAGENLVARLEGVWRGDAFFTANLKLSGGGLYLDPVFLEAAPKAPIRLDAAGQLQDQRLRLNRVRLRHPGALSAEGSMTLRLGETAALEAADVTIAEAIFPAFYDHYLDALLGAGVELETAGRVQGRLRWSGGRPAVMELSLNDLRLEDARDRYGLDRLNGWLAWGRDATPRRSDLRWQSGHIYQLNVGGGTVALESQRGGIRVLGETRVPLLDGRIIVDRLAGRDLTAASPDWDFSGRVAEISMERLSAALGWPLLSGSVSGMIPGLRYAEGTLVVGGALLVQVFGGDVVVTDLRLEEPFGAVPVLYANVDVRGLDLAALTRTFDVGRIEGRLGGEIRDLRLENWQPTRFQARFATPPDDPSRHRISQRAVQSLSALGGAGVGAALGRGFVGLFDEFNYKRLGLSCRLRNGVCEMNGVAPANGGYYIVEGAGLPRIDVIGYNRRVDWDELLRRLQAAAASESPTVR